METKQEIYEEIVRLTSEIKDTDVAKKIFDAAKELDGIKKVEEIFETFKSENPELHLQIVSFGMRINELHETDESSTEIFSTGPDEEKGIRVFDTDAIDSLSFYFLVLIAEIDDLGLFEDFDGAEDIIDSLKMEGYEDLADFIQNSGAVYFIGDDKQYTNFYELLVAIFNGEFADE